MAKEQKSNKPEVDIINSLLEDCIMAFPVSSFVISLYQQYIKRGYLSKKQLQGLHNTASKITDLAPGKLATLEALIRKMPTRFRSALPENSPLYEKEEETGKLIKLILEKFPQHKRVLFLRSKYDHHELLSPSELADLKRIADLANKR